jgi:predicted dehydrogenase
MAVAKQLRWGLLSTARINQAIIEPLRNSERSILSAVASRSAVKAAEYSKTWSIPKYYSSYEALLEDPEIDVIYNSLPNSLHAEWSIKAMRHGKHVLCEKPLTTRPSDVDELISTAKETRMVIAEAFMYRHHPQTILVKKLVQDGEIGDLQYIHGSFCYMNTRKVDLRFELELGGGSLWDVGCYPISYFRFLTGSEPIEVFGHQVDGHTGIDLLFAGQLLFPGNVLSQFDCSFISPHISRIEITGSGGRIIIPIPYKPGLHTEITVDNGESIRIIPIKGEPLYLGEVADIENAILNGTSPRISLDDSRGNVAAIEALYQSAKQNQSVKI